MKKIISLLSVATVLLSVAAMPASAESTTSTYDMVKGKDLDFNNDGNLNQIDWAIYLAYCFSFDGQGPDYVPPAEFDKLIEKGDIDNDGKLTGNDMSIVSTVVEGKMEDYLPGDVNIDGIVDGSDATLTLSCYTELSSGTAENSISYYNMVKGYGDMDGDGVVSGIDAAEILRLYTGLSSQ